MAKSKSPLPLYKGYNVPCDPDHNGECLICNNWLSDCVFKRFIDGDIQPHWGETTETMIALFNNHLTKKQITKIKESQKT